MIKAAIFDMDGVIADSHTEINALFTNVLNNHLNLNISVEEFSKYPGLRFEHRAELFAKKKGIDLSKEEVEKVMKIGRDEYYHNTLNYIKLYSGVVDLLEELKNAGIKMGIGSNGSRRSILKIIEQFKIKEYFSSIVTYDDVSHGKPNPEIFMKNAENLNVKPEECVVIDDAEVGIEAAKSAGMKIISITTTMDKKELEKADMIIDKISDLNLEKIRELE